MSEQSEISLPPGFDELAPFAASWGRCFNQQDRHRLRERSSIEELRRYYDATVPRLEEIFALLDSYPFRTLPEPAALLYRIALGLTEAALAIEIFAEPTVPFTPSPQAMTIHWRGQK